MALKQDIRSITELAVAGFNKAIVEAAHLEEAEIERGRFVYKSYWTKARDEPDKDNKKYNWTPSEYACLGFQYKFVNKWLGEAAKDRVMEWYQFFSNVYDQRLLQQIDPATGAKKRIRLFLLGAGPCVELYALVVYLVSRQLDESHPIADVHAYDIADWSDVTRVLLESYSSLPCNPVTSPPNGQLRDANSVQSEKHTLMNRDRLRDIFTRLQAVSHYNRLRLSPSIEEARDFDTDSLKHGMDVNDAATRAKICSEINRHSCCEASHSDSDNESANALNIVCVSHWFSHCTSDDCEFMRRLQAEIGSSSCVDMFLSEEHPAFRGGAGVHARAGYTSAAAQDDRFADSIAEHWTGFRVDEGFQGFKLNSRNYYFYTNHAQNLGIRESCPPAKKPCKAESQWEQLLFGCDAQQQSRLEELLRKLETWKAEHMESISKVCDPFPISLLKRIACDREGRECSGHIAGKKVGRTLLRHPAGSCVAVALGQCVIPRWIACKRQKESPCDTCDTFQSHALCQVLRRRIASWFKFMGAKQSAAVRGLPSATSSRIEC
eukprot:TRINITY_DN63579_c0_g1_i1.p1 TRINITY_DN63579_c0_g1~~TRINITY_DN63579_c0_g1_i1.p1  ORF type:complete len:549 (-),score=52.85 TRINITY_DN63579_c0_g1_i1:23-1669(-)